MSVNDFTVAFSSNSRLLSYQNAMQRGTLSSTTTDEPNNLPVVPETDQKFPCLTLGIACPDPLGAIGKARTHAK